MATQGLRGWGDQGRDEYGRLDHVLTSFNTNLRMLSRVLPRDLLNNTSADEYHRSRAYDIVRLLRRYG